MKKRVFLTSIATLAAAMTIDASAAFPKLATEQLLASISPTVISLKMTAAQNPFVLERPTTLHSSHSYHSSHSSHASHRSHTSSRY